MTTTAIRRLMVLVSIAFAAVGVIAVWPKVPDLSTPAAYCSANEDSDIPLADKRYKGPQVTSDMLNAIGAGPDQASLVVWRCMDSAVYACLEQNTLACARAPWLMPQDWSYIAREAQSIQECRQQPEQDCLSGTHCIFACRNGVPVLRRNDYPVDGRGFSASDWKRL